MKVLVCGGRDYKDYRAVDKALHALNREDTVTHVIHGGATGADECAGSWARCNGVQEVICKANWQYHGKAAGPIRNLSMAALKPDVVVAFPGGAGTASMVAVAKEQGLKVIRPTESENAAKGST